MSPLLRRGVLSAAGIVALGGAPSARAQSSSCATATPIAPGASSAGSTVSLTTDGSCSCDPTSAHDVWYSLYAPTSGTLTVTLCGSSFNTVLSLHSGCPGSAANQIACNDDSCGQQSALTASVLAGHTYLIRIAGYSGAAGAFTIHTALGSAHAIGSDLVVTDLTDVTNWGAAGGITAYSVGAEGCNRGDAPVSWSGFTSGHPVFSQNLYRLRGGRFVHIGQAWAKHAYASDNGPGCGTCQQPPGGTWQLGVGCSDAYLSDTNGLQTRLGPRSQVNATTGVLAYPFTAPPYSTVIDRRLQVATTDITPQLQPGALYFFEAGCITADDAQGNNALNNVSYRQTTISSATATPVLIGNVQQGAPAIQAWAEQDPGVTLVTADYLDAGITARFWVAAKATSNGNGTWHYEYAVYNQNADRAAGRFSIPATGVTITNPGFHAPPSHSGEVYDNAAWTSGQSAEMLSFTTATYAANPNANALRWGTLDNFWFDASTAPTTGSAVLGLFAPGSPTQLTIADLPVPAGSSCYANCDGSTTPPILNIADFLCFQSRFAAGDPYANCDNSTIPPVLNINDFTCFASRFTVGCQ